MRSIAPHGSWRSPITARDATAGMSAGQPAAPSYVDIVGEDVWWTEPRPDEDGRTALVRARPDGTVHTVLPAPWNVRSRVIEYGGRPWTATAAGAELLVVFVHFSDQRLYALHAGEPGAEPWPLTPVSPAGGGLRWSEPEIDPVRGHVRAVLEEFTGEGPGDLRRVIAAVPLDGSAAHDRAAVRELGGDRRRFVSGPRLSPDGRRAAWLAWDHPYMPWDAAELVVADIAADGRLLGARTLLGGPGEAVAQAEWAPDGCLVAASERSGWWNLHRVDPDTGEARPLYPAEEEFAGAQRLGLRWFAPLEDGRVAVLHGRGAQRAGVLDPATGELADLGGRWTEWLPHLAVRGTRLTGVAAGPDAPYEVVEADLGALTARAAAPGRESGTVHRAYLPASEARVFTGPGGREIHAHIHPPRNPDVAGPDAELPPYVVWAHGGPGLRSPLVLNQEIAYFTSRGIGVVDVNYGGTPGYGRAYRERLRGQWGVVDVADCAAVALALVAEGLAARDRLAIRGGSAGGFTAAASLVATDLYACATLLYPVLDLESFAAGLTHDFESHYLDHLIGPPGEVPDRYRERSPAGQADRVTAPFLLLQGADDVMCPPEQAERFLRAADRHHVPHTHRLFEGEGHGFRRASTMVACLEAELALYAEVFGFRPDGERPPGRDGARPGGGD